MQASHVHSQPSKRETLIQWTRSATRLPGGSLRWQRPWDLGKRALGTPAYYMRATLHSLSHFTANISWAPTMWLTQLIFTTILLLYSFYEWGKWGFVKSTYLAQGCKLVKEVSRVWTQRVGFFPDTKTDSLPLRGAGPSTQPVCWTAGPHRTKQAGGSGGGGVWVCWWKHGGGNGSGVSDSKLPLEVWEPWECWCSEGNWPDKCCPLAPAAFESKECMTRMWSQMPHFFVILQGPKMSGNHYFTFFKSAFVNSQKYIFLMYLEHLSNFA